MQDLPKGIRKRGAKYFVDVSYKGQRRTATCDSLSHAEATRRGLLTALHTGRESAQRRANAVVWTLQQALDKTLSLPAPEGWRGCSYEKQAGLNAQDAINFMGPNIRLDEISLDLINAWSDSCEAKGNSNSTINRKLSALSKLFTVAEAYGGVDHKPKLPKLRKEPVGRIRQISQQEEETLIELLQFWGYVDEAEAVQVLIDTGVRCGELWNLCWEDVSFAEGVMLVYGEEGKGTKGGKCRSVFMTKRVENILRARHGMNLRKPFDIGGNARLRKAWDKARGQMGLAGDKNFTPHVCRHTCASRLVRAGTTIPVVQAWLGHSNIQTTMRYAHLYPADLKAAVKALERS